MATIQDVFSHIYTTESHLSEVPIKNGQIVLCVDSEKLYIDHGSNRVSISDVVQVETQTALPLAPLDKFYITQDTGDVYFYINDEWKKLTDTIKDYTAFEVYANDSVISPGEHEVLGTITVEIPVQMTETFALRTTTPEADSDVVVDWGDGTIQKVKDGEHGGYTGPDGEGRYVAKMTHTYGTAGKYTVKVYGHDYFCLSHAPNHVSDASNMQCRILADDLPIASHLTNLTAFAYGTLKLVTVQCASYKYLHRTTNHAQMFTNDKNLLSVTGFEDMVMISRGAEGCFQFCENMHTCDFNGVLCSNNPRAMYAMFQNCYALAINIGTFFPTKFVSRALNFTNTFTHMHAMTGTVNAKQLWGDPTIDWQGYSNCFYGCPEEIRAQVPTAWGGTASDPVAYELTVDSITLNGHATNTANGLVILNAQGKVDNTLLPDTSIDLSNYSQNASIKLTSTAGAVDLISNTMEVALYSGTAHIKANVDSVELQGTNLKFNNNAQNTAGGIVVVDKESGKIPDTVLPESTTVDLGNYNGNVSLTASGGDQSISLKYDATSTSGSSYTSTLLLDNSKIDIDANAGNINMMAHTVMVGTLQRTLQTAMINASDLQINVTNLLFNNHPTNTANGIAVVGENGKLPASIVPETSGSVDLSAYNGLVGITTTGVSAISNGASGEYKFTLGTNSNGVILTEEGRTRTVTIRSMETIYISGGAVHIAGYPFTIHSNGELKLSSSQGNIILDAQDSVDANIEMHGTGILWNGAALNTASGLVVLGGDGKIPTTLYDATIDLSNYQTNGPIKLTTTSNTGDGSGDITITTSENIILKGGVYDKIEIGNATMHITSEAAVLINGQTGFVFQNNGTDVISESAGYLTLTDGDINLNGTLHYNGASVNAPNGLVRLDESGRLPAVDGSQLTNLPVATVDLSNYSTSTIHLTSTDGDVKLTTGNGNGSIQLTVTDDGNPDRATFKTPGVWDIQMGSYLTKITGTQQMDIEADGSACPVKITAGSNGGDIELNASGSIKFNGADLNTANGLVKLGQDGKIPTGLYDAGGNTDLSSYTGFVDITGKNGDSTIHAADGNLVLSSDSNVVLGGIYVACQTDFITPSVSSESGDLLIRTSNSEHSIVLAPGSFFQGNPADAPSGSIKFYADNIVYNDHQQNTPGGVAVVGSDGKLPPTILPESTGGDTTQLESRVSALEGTVGTLDAAVDEILADYGEGSGALVYRVVASATEPENPTEGMIWIQTE